MSLSFQSPSPIDVFGVKQKADRFDKSASAAISLTPLIPSCPKCGSDKVWRDGHYSLMFGDPIRRYRCGNCERRFSDSQDLAKAKEAVQSVETIESKRLKSASHIHSTRQICDKNPEKGTKNLVTEQQSISVPQRPELTTEQRQTLKGKIVEFMFQLQKDGAAEDTYMVYSENLKFLVKNNADLLNPVNTREVIGLLKKSEARKYTLVKAYKSFMNYSGLKGEMPVYSYIRTLPFIPIEKEIDQLIVGCMSFSRQMGVFIWLLKETGARAGEAYRLTWGDIDEVAKTVSITPEKGSNPRLNKITEKLLLQLSSLKPANLDPKASIFIWKKKSYIGHSFRKMRKRIVADTQNQRLAKIHFHTLRYWKGTMTYIKTKSLAHVMVQLGHKSWSAAQLYVSLADAVAPADARWTSTVARSLEEALKLTSEGWIYDTDWEPGVKIYKKQVETE